VPDDPVDNSEWAPGTFCGGFQINLRWLGGGRHSEEACSEAARCLKCSDRVVDKVWQLACGTQYAVASYSPP
jgi:hypothetical protein